MPSADFWHAIDANLPPQQNPNIPRFWTLGREGCCCFSASANLSTLGTTSSGAAFVLMKFPSFAACSSVTGGTQDLSATVPSNQSETITATGPFDELDRLAATTSAPRSVCGEYPKMSKTQTMARVAVLSPATSVPMQLAYLNHMFTLWEH